MRKIILVLLSLAVIGALLSIAGPYQTANAGVEVAKLLVEECTPDADFVADITVPDDTIFQPGESFEKVWRLKNSGDCGWSEKYALTFIKGDQMGAPNSQPLGKAVAAGGTVDIGVKMTAPDKDGVYTSYWQMADAEGALFGDVIYVRIVVKALAPTPPPGETPAEPTTGWVKYQAEGFELSLPETWKVIPLEKEELELMVKSMKETDPQLAGYIEMLLNTGLYGQFRLSAVDTESIEFLTNLNVIYLPTPVTVRVYIASTKSELEEVLGAKIIATDDTLEINGLQAGRIDYEWAVQTPGGGTALVRGVQYGVIVDAKEAYIVTFGAGAQQYEAQSPVFERIINSFSLTESE